MVNFASECDLLGGLPKSGSFTTATDGAIGYRPRKVDAVTAVVMELAVWQTN